MACPSEEPSSVTHDPLDLPCRRTPRGARSAGVRSHGGKEQRGEMSILAFLEGNIKFSYIFNSQREEKKMLFNTALIWSCGHLHSHR